MSDEAEKEDTHVLSMAWETFILSFELIGWEVVNAPDQLDSALQQKDVQEAINKGLIAFAASRLSTTPTAVSSDDAMALLKLVGESAGKPLAPHIIDEIKKSKRYKALDKAAQDLSAEFKKVPVGAWITKNKTWLYIVGAGAVLGGAVAMYVTRSGDILAKPLALVSTDPKPIKQIGSLKFGVGLDKIAFTPSERLIEVKPFLTADCDYIKTKLDISVMRSDKTATVVSATGSVLVPISDDVKLTAKGGLSTTKDWNLSLGVKIDVVKGVQLDVFGGIGKGPLMKPPSSIPFNDPPPGTTKDDRTHGFVGLGLSGTF